MSDNELVKKRLRSLLQSSKVGVPIKRLQSDYVSLCGETIPLNKLGYSKLEDYIRSIPSVVRLKYHRGELRCFAVVYQATAPIATVVAKQKDYKKPDRFQVNNGRGKFKPSNLWTPRGGAIPGKGVISTSTLPPSLAQSSTETTSEHARKSKYSKVKKTSFQRRADRPVYPRVLPKQVMICSNISPSSLSNSNTNTTPISSHESTSEQRSSPSTPFPVPKPEIFTKKPLAKNTFIFPPPHGAASSAEVLQKTKKLLSKYKHGLWAHALPKFFMDAYKIPFPKHILDDLSVLLDICTVEFPMGLDKKAILYALGGADNSKGNNSPSGLVVLGPVVPPSLVLPSEQYPTVLVTDAKRATAVTIRYVGENYSNAQEAMEDAILSFYSHSSNCRPLTNPVVGQLGAVRMEHGHELVRAQVIEVMNPSMVKVYYMDYGFSVETRRTNLLELHQDFLSLPFQTINVKLADLEAFSSHPLVLSTLSTSAVGKILLMETLPACRKNPMPVSVLYDTSQDEDISINSTCLKALQDKTMNNPLIVNATYQDLSVTEMCADGIIYCQLPSRGTARLSKLLKGIELIFDSQLKLEFLVCRPFVGKLCLAFYKGQLSRTKITYMYGKRVMKVLFIDLGVKATVKVTDLRQVPRHFFREFILIPPQVITCRLAGLKVPEEDWSPMTIHLVKEAILASENSQMKILKLDQHKGDLLVYMYLFTGTDSEELGERINRQLAQSEPWHMLTTHNNINNISTITSSDSSTDIGLSDLLERMTLGQPVQSPIFMAPTQPSYRAEDSFFPDATTITGMQSPLMTPPLELPKPGQCVDVVVSAACHPGYFVLQQWQNLHELVMLMENMAIYYNQMWKTFTASNIQKEEVYAVNMDNNWHRMQVKGILANEMYSVYGLDDGKNKLVHKSKFQPLFEEFRQLPFQAMTAQLAGATQHQWSEEASMIFRSYVEDRALVAKVMSVQENSEVEGDLSGRRLTVYLVDTAQKDEDLWIHSIMANIDGDPSLAT